MILHVFYIIYIYIHNIHTYVYIYMYINFLLYIYDEAAHYILVHAHIYIISANIHIYTYIRIHIRYSLSQMTNRSYFSVSVTQNTNGKNKNVDSSIHSFKQMESCLHKIR